MNALMNLKRTAMTSSDPTVLDSYLASNQVNNERIEDLLDRNNCLNEQVNSLKNALNKLSEEGINQVSDQQLLDEITILETQNKHEKKNCSVLTRKVRKLEALLDEVYEIERVPKIDNKLLTKMKVLENNYNSEKNKNVLLALKSEELQSVINGANTIEKASESTGNNDIKSINNQLSFLIKRLKGRSEVN